MTLKDIFEQIQISVFRSTNESTWMIESISQDEGARR
jgi:hypothetical protein